MNRIQEVSGSGRLYTHLFQQHYHEIVRRYVLDRIKLEDLMREMEDGSKGFTLKLTYVNRAS